MSSQGNSDFNGKQISEMSDDEILQYISLLVDEDELAFQENITQLRKQAEITKASFLATAPFDIKDQPNYHNANHLIKIYADLMFFPDEEVFKKFEAFGFKKILLNWFLKLDDIIRECDNISGQTGIIIWRNKLLERIKLFYILQITIDVQIWALEFTESKKGIKKTNLIADLERVYRRKNYGGGTIKKEKGLKDSFLIACVMEFTTLEKELNLEEEAILQLLKGQRPFHFLSDILNNCFFTSKRKSETDYFLSSLYDLFKLFLKDLFKATANDDSEKYSGKSFHGARAHAMRGLIYKDTGKKSTRYLSK